MKEREKDNDLHLHIKIVNMNTKFFSYAGINCVYQPEDSAVSFHVISYSSEILNITQTCLPCIGPWEENCCTNLF